MKCYNPKNRHAREGTWSEITTPDGRWRAYYREHVLQRDKASLDIFWLKDASMTDVDNLPEPEVLADEIIEHLRSALRQLRGSERTLSVYSFLERRSMTTSICPCYRYPRLPGELYALGHV